jgi:hypothetical protein
MMERTRDGVSIRRKVTKVSKVYLNGLKKTS